MIKKIATILKSPSDYMYKCVCLFTYTDTMDNITNATFYIGNPKTTIHEACVTILVFFPHKDSLVDPSVASLNLLKYYESCSENKPLQKGKGTVDMLNTAMSFVLQICPFITEFKFNDASTIQCNNGSTISLPYYSITRTHKTWYQNTFQAYLKEPFLTAYTNAMAKVMNTSLPAFNVFIQNHVKHTPGVIVNQIQSIYEEGDTVQAFFSKLYNKYDKFMGCIMIQPWIDTFMRNVGLHTYIINTEWFISSKVVPTHYFKMNHSNMYKVNMYRKNNTRKKNIWNK